MKQKTEKIDVRLYGVDQGDSVLLQTCTITVKRVGDAWVRQGGPESFVWENRTDREIRVTAVRVQAPRTQRQIMEEVTLPIAAPALTVKGRQKGKDGKKWAYNMVTTHIPKRVIEIAKKG